MSAEAKEQGQEGFHGQSVLPGGYQLLRALSGGATPVYRAQDSSGRLVAVEVFPGVHDLTVSKALREGVARSQEVRHPVVVPMESCRRGPASSWFAVSDYVEGTRLSDWADDIGIPPLDQLVALMRVLCEALAAAEERGMVHGALNPKKVLVSKAQDSASFPVAIRLLGLGVPHTLRGWHPSARSVPFMAPEQWAGLRSRIPRHVEHLEASADVYSCGCLLYYLCTGGVPVAGRNVEEVAEQCASRRVAVPSRINPSIPEELDAIILRALEQQPARRFAGPTALAHALAAVPLSRHVSVSATLPLPHVSKTTPPPALPGAAVFIDEDTSPRATLRDPIPSARDDERSERASWPAESPTRPSVPTLAPEASAGRSSAPPIPAASAPAASSSRPAHLPAGVSSRYPKTTHSDVVRAERSLPSPSPSPSPSPLPSPLPLARQPGVERPMGARVERPVVGVNVDEDATYEVDLSGLKVDDTQPRMEASPEGLRRDSSRIQGSRRGVWAAAGVFASIALGALAWAAFRAPADPETIAARESGARSTESANAGPRSARQPGASGEPLQPLDEAPLQALPRAQAAATPSPAGPQKASADRLPQRRPRAQPSSSRPLGKTTPTGVAATSRVRRSDVRDRARLRSGTPRAAPGEQEAAPPADTMARLDPEVEPPVEAVQAPPQPTAPAAPSARDPSPAAAPSVPAPVAPQRVVATQTPRPRQQTPPLAPRTNAVQTRILGFQLEGSPATVAVGRAVARAGRGFSACYRNALRNAPAPRYGRVSVQVVIDARGRVIHPQVTGAPLRGLGECIAKVASMIKTRPQPGLGRVRARWTVEYAPK